MSSSPADAGNRQMVGSHADHAVNLVYKLARFMSNPGTIGKSEMGEVLGELMLFIDGGVLPPGNHISRKMKEIGFTFTDISP